MCMWSLPRGSGKELKGEKEMKYYLIASTHTPYLCNPITANIVISEDVESFLARNSGSDCVKKYGAKFVVSHWSETTKEHYDKLKQNNPGSSSHFRLKKEDYAYIDNYCRDCINKSRCSADHLAYDGGNNCPDGLEYDPPDDGDDALIY